jgi:hypothetical protein
MMSSNVERAREIVTRLYERNLVSWNDLDREVVFVIQALNAEVQRLEALTHRKKFDPERDDEIAKLIYGTQATYQEMQFAALIRADEREACANIDFYEILRDICGKAQAQEYSNYIEIAIRARGNT